MYEHIYTEYLRAPNQMIANSKARSYERDYGDGGERTTDHNGKKIYCSEAYDWWISTMPASITEIEVILINGEMLVLPIPTEE